MFQPISPEQIEKLVNNAFDTLGRTSATLRLASMETDDFELARELWRRAYALEVLSVPIDVQEEVTT
jgi:hypothetical protein